MPRQAKEIDTGRFEPLMAEALKAYAQDPGFAISMAEAATHIEGKRLLWKARIALREAEAAAQAACVVSDLPSCERQSPCGTSTCPWAPAELQQIDVAPVAVGIISKGRSTRPKPRIGDGALYTIESAVRVLVAARKGQSGVLGQQVHDPHL